MSSAFKTGVIAYARLKTQKLTEREEKITKAVITHAYKELIISRKEAEAYALFRIATEVFTEDYNTFLGLKHTRLTDFT